MSLQTISRAVPALIPVSLPAGLRRLMAELRSRARRCPPPAMDAFDRRPICCAI